MKEIDTEWLGNYFGFTQGRNYDGWVIGVAHYSYTLLACMSHGNVPKIIVKDKRNDKSR